MTDSAAFTSSPFVSGIEPITETDDEIAAYLADAELPPLLPAIAYVTGDLSVLRPELRPDPLLFGQPQGGLTDDQQAHVRAVALDALAAYRDGGCTPAPLATDEVVLQLMEFAVGGGDMDAYVPLIEEELAHGGADQRAPDWHRSDFGTDCDFRVLIVGAGMSGILAAHRLQQAGVSFTIVDKNDDVGGTWLENTYPGCRVDNPNHNYSYSFAERHDWPFHYSTSDVLREYFQDCADAFDVRDKVRFGVEVERATWSEADQEWTVELRTADGRESVSANAVISAVGQLNRPLFPDIDGQDRFAGESWHSARWRHDVDLSGKRVAVIGTGASAVQFVPEIAPDCASLTVFQRTPPWMGPTADYHDEIAPGFRWLLRKLPSYSEWNRFSIFWRMGDAGIEGVRVDPDWDQPGSVSLINVFGREVLADYLREQFAGRPDLADVAVPDYPVGAKRILRDNGSWPQALMRDNVSVVTDRISAIAESGIETDDGTVRDFDIIIYGTGFQASKFLTPMQVIGRDGADLHEQWGGDARAYLGVAIPNFPNFWCLYGPNTNIVINGSIIYFSECGVRYIVGLVKELLARDATAVDVRKDVHDEFNEAVDAENKAMAWGWADVNSWYKSASGRVAQNWPFTLLEYWQRTLVPDPDEYEFTIG